MRKEVFQGVDGLGVWRHLVSARLVNDALETPHLDGCVSAAVILHEVIDVRARVVSVVLHKSAACVRMRMFRECKNVQFLFLYNS